MSVNGLRAFAPNVPSKATNSLTNNTSGTPTLKVAVLHQVAPNNNNPSMASVLIENRFPPVAGFSLPSGFGPVYLPGTVGAPANGPFVNSPTTMEGGSLVTVDTVTNTVIGLRQGISTQFPGSATIQVQNHVHTGAIDPSTGFPMPEQVDLVSHVQNQLTKPNYAEMPLETFANASSVIEAEDHVGYPAYNSSIIFSLDHYGTTANPWLNQIQIVALPAGSPQDIASNYGKALYDTVAALAPGTDYNGSNIGGQGATYRVYVGGLTAGISYNIYVIYVDFYGNTSLFGPAFPTSKLVTTPINPITVTNLPGLGTLPVVGYDSQTASGIGQTQFNANVKFEVNYTGTTASTWCEEIRLYATYWDASANGGTGLPDGSGAPYTYPNGQPAAPVLVNIIGPNISVNTNKVYFAEWPGLSLGSGVFTQYIYRLSIAFVAENGDESHLFHICYTNNQVVTMYRPALAGVSPFSPIATLHGSPGFPFNGNPVYDCEFVFDTDINGSNYNFGLNYIQLVAYPYGADITSASNLGKILYDELVPLRQGYDYNGSLTGLTGARYHAYVGGLNGGTEYHIAIIYVGFDGSVSQSLVLVNTGDYGSHIVTSNNLPGVGTLPVITEVNHTETPVGNSAYNELLSYTINYTGTNAYQWLQEIELYSCLWDNALNRPAKLADNVTYSTPILRNIVSPGNIVNGTGSVTYIGEWPSLVASNNSGAPYYYRLGIRYVAQNGDKSDNSSNTGSPSNSGNFGHLDPVTYIYTTAPFTQIVQRGTLATLASYVAPTMTVDGGYPQYPFDGDPIYACDIVFDTTDGTIGTSVNAALDYILVSAYPVGSDLTTSHNINIVTPLRYGYDYNGSNLGINGSRYKIRVGGLTGNIHYVIVAQYVDFGGNKTSPFILVSDTGSHPVTAFNLPGLGTQPPIHFLAATESNSGTSAFNALIAVSLNNSGIDTSWCEEIELYTCLWNLSTNTPAKLTDGATYATPVLVNIIAFIPSTGIAEYLWEFPSLIAGNGIADPHNSGQTEAYYALGVRFIALNGTKSDNSANNGTFGHSDPTTYIFTSGSTKLIVSSSQVVNRNTLATMPSLFIPTTPSSCSISTTLNRRTARAVLTFTLDANGYKSNPWLDKIRIFATNTYWNFLGLFQAAGDGNPNEQIYDSSAIDGSTTVNLVINNNNIYQIAEQYFDVTPQVSGQYMTAFNLTCGNYYYFFFSYLDHSGRMSCPQQFGAFTHSGPGASINGFYCGYLANVNADGKPISTINPGGASMTSYAVKNGSVYAVTTVISLDTSTYSNYVEYVDFWAILTTGGVETGSQLQYQRLPYSQNGSYNPAFSGLTPSSTYHIYVKYIAYGASVNKWNSASVLLASSPSFFTLNLPA